MIAMFVAARVRRMRDGKNMSEATSAHISSISLFNNEKHARKKSHGLELQGIVPNTPTDFYIDPMDIELGMMLGAGANGRIFEAMYAGSLCGR